MACRIKQDGYMIRPFRPKNMKRHRKRKRLALCPKQRDFVIHRNQTSLRPVWCLPHCYLELYWPWKRNKCDWVFVLFDCFKKKQTNRNSCKFNRRMSKTVNFIQFLVVVSILAILAYHCRTMYFTPLRMKHPLCVTPIPNVKRKNVQQTVTVWFDLGQDRWVWKWFAAATQVEAENRSTSILIPVRTTYRHKECEQGRNS